MRIAALLFALMLVHPAALAAESVDALLSRAGFERLEALASEIGFPEVRKVAGAIVSGEWSPDDGLMTRALKRLSASLRDGLLDALAALAAPVLATLCLKLTLGRTDGALTLLCRLATAGALARRFAGAAHVAGEALSAAARVAETLSPVLSAALAITGSGASAAMLTPLSSLCVDAIHRALYGAGLPLCALAAAVAAGGGLSDHFRLDRLFTLIRRTAVWGVRLIVGAFVGLLALEGRLAAAQDTASSAAIRQAMRGMIPFIGGSVSDATGALLESALAVRGVVGVTGMLIALAACARPVMTLGASMLSLTLASAVIEPVADRGVVRITGYFADVAKLLLALCVGSAMLSVLLAGACMGVLGSG